MRKNIIFVRGVPGSGKTSFAEIARGHFQARNKTTRLLSTDDFWEKDGKYQLIPQRLNEAHNDTQARFSAACVDLMEGQIQNIIVHNTFTMFWEIYPYLSTAWLTRKALKRTGESLDIMIFSMQDGLQGEQDVYERGLHGVPKNIWDRMVERYQDLEAVENKVHGVVFYREGFSFWEALKEANKIKCKPRSIKSFLK